MVAILLQATRSQSIWRQLEELQVKDESSISWYKQVYSIGFLCLQLIHILALLVSSSSAWIFAEHIQPWNQNSLNYGVWNQGGVDYIVSPFPEHNYWSCGFRSSSPAVAQRGLFDQVTQTCLICALTS